MRSNVIRVRALHAAFVGLGDLVLHAGEQTFHSQRNPVLYAAADGPFLGAPPEFPIWL